MIKKIVEGVKCVEKSRWKGGRKDMLVGLTVEIQSHSLSTRDIRDHIDLFTCINEQFKPLDGGMRRGDSRSPKTSKLTRYYLI